MGGTEIERMELKKVYPFYLASRAVMGANRIPVSNKFTCQTATEVCVASSNDIDAAISAAVKAQEKMAKLGSYERKAILNHMVNRLTERREELARTLCIEAGKPIKDSRGEVDRAITTFQLAAEEATRIYGDYLPLDIDARTRGYEGIVKKFPNGPVSMISPFNFPINLAAHKIAPAIAVGCSFVLKPASRTPLGALLMGEMLAECDLLPEGAFSILPCAREGATLFTEDPRLKVLSFTGSPAVGWDLKARAGKKKVVLELGGNAAVIIDQGSKLDEVIPRIVIGGYYQSGQSCIGVQRVYCHEDLYASFKEKLVKAVQELKHGDPLEEDTFIGPIISEGEANRIQTWVDAAKEAGGKVLVGGTRKGLMVQATLLEGVPHHCDLYREEVFGPVVLMEPYSDFDDVLAKVNDSKFGLQAGIFTPSIQHAFKAFKELEMGGVVVNDVPSVRVDSQPYGGVKDSGLGREGLRYAMEDMLEERILLMRNIGN